MNFLKNILSTLLALFIFSLAAFFIFVSVISALSAEEKFVVKSNSVLHLKFDRPITELEFDNPLEEFGAFSGPSSSIGLMELKKSIRNAATDSNIDGILLDLKVFMGGMASLQEVRQELEDFKESGKFIYAYSEYYTEGAYYLASVADKVILNPEGELEFNGLNANVTFLKGTLEKFGVEAQIFRVGEYKSAVEPFLRKDLSNENKLQLTELLGSVNNVMIEDIARSRGLTSDKVKEVSDGMLIRVAEDAISMNFVDELMYEDEVFDLISEASNEDYEFVNYGQYKDSFSDYKKTSNKVAVIVASGEIVMGKGDENTVGSAKFAKLIRDARLDDGIDAMVIRINSPGGSYIASDVMWREIKLASETKPVIASMSDYAASGGYYMAMACDTIVAQPNTITGSIGIFGMLFNFEEMLEDRLGITHDEVNTGDYSGMFTVTRSLTDIEKAIIQKNLEKNYDTFITKAAEGRSMPKDDLLKVASGRVWTGTQAEDKGLVDLIGSFDDAVAIAAEKAGIADDYKIRIYPEPKPFFEQLMEDFGSSAKAQIVKGELGELHPFANELKKIKNLRGVQARMPYDLDLN